MTPEEKKELNVLAKSINYSVKCYKNTVRVIGIYNGIRKYYYKPNDSDAYEFIKKDLQEISAHGKES